MKSENIPSTIELTIDKLSHDGRGLARLDGKIVFVEGALPGERVICSLKRSKKDFAEARTLEVLEASPLRAEPICDHYHLCGGCSLQHLQTQEQIKTKEAILLELLEHVGHVSPETILPPLQDETRNYRNKARLSVKFVEKKGQAMVGFREKHSPRYIAAIESCSILHSKVDKDLMALRTLIGNLQDKSEIAQIEIAAGDEEIALIFRNLKSLSMDDEAQLKQFGQSKNYRIYLQPQGEDSVYCLYPENDESLLRYYLPEQNLTLHFHPTDFTQINAGLNRKMVARALEFLELQPEDVVLDLFCGLGNFSLPIAQSCAKVIGVEGSKKMVDRAGLNARLNQLPNTEFYAANLDDEKEVQAMLNRKFNKVLLDPPRSGAYALVQQLGQHRPERIVYISCNPITLARDAQVLVNEYGYRLQSAGVMDMFSHTAHVESMAVFLRE